MNLEPQIASSESQHPPEPGERRQVKDSICAEVSRRVQAAYPKGLVALVLTGSMARDEATITREGEFQVVHGDVDFFLVSVEADTARDESLRIATVTEIEKNLLSQGIRVHIGINQILPSYLSSLPRYIATYELRKCGQVLLGNKNILALIPEFNPADISREDAWRMLCNRMIELLEFIPAEDSEARHSDSLEYATVKLSLDVATSYLVFAKLYDPTYRGRETRLKAIVRNRSVAAADAPFDLESFSKRLAASTQWKLGERSDELSSMLPTWNDAATDALNLWHWELVRLTGATEPVSNGALWHNWARSLSATQRIRGWLSVARRCALPVCVKNAARWTSLGRRATPRYWIYSAAQSLLADRLNAGSRSASEALGRSLAGDVMRVLPESSFSALGSSSGWLTRSNCVVRGYKAFLVGTLA